MRLFYRSEAFGSFGNAPTFDRRKKD